MYDGRVSDPERYATVGSLAAALRGATYSLSQVEGDVSDLITSLFPGWRPLFPRERGWIFVAPDTINVYGVTIVDSPAATAALWLAGFGRVILHDHQRSDERCACAPKIDPATPDVTPPRGSTKAPSSRAKSSPRKPRGG
jgi:hypothetical protein